MWAGNSLPSLSKLAEWRLRSSGWQAPPQNDVKQLSAKSGQTPTFSLLIAKISGSLCSHINEKLMIVLFSGRRAVRNTWNGWNEVPGVCGFLADTSYMELYCETWQPETCTWFLKCDFGMLPWLVLFNSWRDRLVFYSPNTRLNSIGFYQLPIWMPAKWRTCLSVTARNV